MGDIPIDRAYLVALWLETYLFGVYSVVFFTGMYLLFFKRRGNVSWILIIPLIALYSLATTHVIVVLIRNIEGFTVEGNKQLFGAGNYFLEASHPLNVANQFIYASNNLFGDSILIWRCWVVWGRSWKAIALPCLLLCATAVTGYNAANQFRLSVHGVFNPGLQLWGKAFFCSTLATNILVTSLIAGRIYWMGRRVSKIGSLPSMGHQYWAIFAIIVESGALYSSALIIEIALYVSHTNAIYVIFDAMAQIIGLVPTLIVVLVGLGLTANQSTVVGTEQSHSIKFVPRRTGVSTGASMDYDQSDRSHARDHEYGFGGGRAREMGVDVDLDNLPSARAIQLPNTAGVGEDWGKGEFMGSNSVGTDAGKNRLSREGTARNGGSSSLVGHAV